MSHEAHAHTYKGLTVRRLSWSLSITLTVMFVELIGGWLSGSIALISDAGHMLTHAFAIAIGLCGILIARRPPCHHRTFGLLRAEIVAAFVNALFLLALTAWIAAAAVQRLRDPQAIMTFQMLTVALLGLIVNLISILLLKATRHGDLNVQSVFLHLVADAGSSVAIVIAAIVIRYTQWIWLDPTVAIGIALLIVIWAVRLLRESLRVLLEMAPKGRDVEEIISAMRQRFPEIVQTSHEHVWTITPEVIVFSAHLQVDEGTMAAKRSREWLNAVTDWLKRQFHISESTLQVTWMSGRDPHERGSDEGAKERDGGFADRGESHRTEGLVPSDRDDAQR